MGAIISSKIFPIFLAALLVGGCGVAVEENTPPVAVAGTDQNVSTGTSVKLDGSGSYDDDNDPVTYQWKIISKPEGSDAELSDTTDVKPKFTADYDGVYIVELIVSDGELESSGDSVIITASSGNSAPVANAGSDQIVAMGSVVTLDGSGSSDADGDILTYMWYFLSLPEGSTVILENDDSVNPVFTADVDGTYDVRLVVNDGIVDSAIDTVSVTTSDLTITIEWDASPSSAAIGYKVYYGTVPGAIIILHRRVSMWGTFLHTKLRFSLLAHITLLLQPMMNQEMKVTIQ